MSNHFRLIGLSLVAILAIVSCQSQQRLTAPGKGNSSASNLPNIQAVTLDSAIFSIDVESFSGQTVNIHRITADWQENVVTWNSFAGAFDPAVSGSFVADVNGWHSANVTTLVQGWMDGTYPNDGLLLDQGSTFFTDYFSSETTQVDLHPMLTLYFTTDSGPEVVIYQRGTNGDVFDTFIRDTSPDENFGMRLILYTGIFDTDNQYNQTLIKFVIAPPPPEEGCTRTIGYWKTHAGFGPQSDVVTPLLPIWLGTSGGTKSLEVTTNTIAHDVLVMRTYGVPSNGITKLYAQLLGAKLNIASGADGSDIASVIAASDAFLATHDWHDWSGLSQSDKATVLGWMESLDDYNNGLTGPGHCDDMDRTS